jgi:hypothetical protein
MWQEAAVYVIVAGAACNLFRTFRSALGPGEGCGKCASNGCASKKSADGVAASPAPLVQLQNNLKN